MHYYYFTYMTKDKKMPKYHMIFSFDFETKLELPPVALEGDMDMMDEAIQTIFDKLPQPDDLAETFVTFNLNKVE